MAVISTAATPVITSAAPWTEPSEARSGCLPLPGASCSPPSVPSPLKAAHLARVAAASLSTNSAFQECLCRIKAACCSRRTAATASSIAASSQWQLQRAAFQAALASSTVAYFLGLPCSRLGPGASSPIEMWNEVLSPRDNVCKAQARCERTAVSRTFYRRRR